MRRLYLLICLALIAGYVGCSKESTGPTGPSLDSPTALTATVLSTESVALNWSNPVEGVEIIVERTLASVEAWEVKVTLAANSRTYTDTGLEEGTAYRYRVTAVSGSSQSDPSRAVSVTTIPAAPTNLVLEQIVGNTIELAWQDHSSRESGFQLERSIADDRHFVLIATLNTDATGYTDADLTEGSIYYYRVRSVLGAMVSDYSTKLLVTVPSSPNQLTATVQDATSIELRWMDQTTDDIGFTVERAPGGSDTWAILGESQTARYTDSGLDEGTSYDYRVKAILPVGESNYSNTASARTIAKAPTGLALANDPQVALRINIRWTDESGVESGFELQRKSSQFDPFLTLELLPANTTGYDDDDVVTASTYSYRVRSLFEGRGSAWTTEVSISTEDLRPVSPSNFRGSVVSTSELNLFWNDNSANENGFVLQRSLIAGGGWEDLASLGADVSTYTDRNLAEQTTYYYRVAAYNEFGSSDWSSVIALTTPSHPPNAPTALTARARSATLVELNWNDASADEQGFNIERSLSQDEGWDRIGTLRADSTYFVDYNAVQLTTLYYRVVAYNDNGNSAPSNVASATTPQAPPAAPSQLNGFAENWFTVKLNWVDNSDNEDNFELQRYDSGLRQWEEIARPPANTDTLTDMGVEQASNYRYRIRATNIGGDDGGGNSGWSNELQISVPDGPPESPRGLTVEPVDYGTLMVSWTGGSLNELHFVLERKTGDGEFQVLAETEPRTTYYEDTRLPAETWFTYRVHAYNEAGPSGYADTAGAMTLSLVLLDDDFEDYNVDQDLTGVNNWDQYNQAGTSWARVTDEDYHSEGKSYKFFDADSGNNFIWMFNAYGPCPRGWFECWVKLTDEGWFDIFGAQGNNDTYAWQVRFIGDSTHTISLRDGGGNPAPSNASWIPDEWMHLRVDFDGDTRLYSVTLNDELIAEDLGTGGNGSVGYVHFLAFSDVQIDAAYIDDVFVQVVLPEERAADAGGPVRIPAASSQQHFDRFTLPTVSNLSR